MQTIIGQISQHPYQGAIAKMYLEAKVQELFAMQVSQLSELNPDAARLSLQRKNSHLGNFSTAFKRQFGITPSQCMAGRLSSGGS